MRFLHVLHLPNCPYIKNAKKSILITSKEDMPSLVAPTTYYASNSFVHRASTLTSLHYLFQNLFKLAISSNPKPGTKQIL